MLRGESSTLSASRTRIALSLLLRPVDEVGGEDLK